MKRDRNRTGFSTNRVVDQAKASTTAATTERSAMPDVGKAAAVNTMNGQCQRYHEYERPPSQTSGLQPSTVRGRPARQSTDGQYRDRR